MMSTVSSTPALKYNPKYLLPKEKLNEIIACISKDSENPTIAPLELHSNFQEHCARQLYTFKTVQWFFDNNDTWNELRDHLQGLIIDLIDPSGKTLLFFYVQDGNIKKLTAIKAHYPLVLFQGGGPLCIAIKLNKDIDFIQKLIDQKIGPICSNKHANKEQCLPIHIAVKKGRAELIERLMPKYQGQLICPRYYYSKKLKLKLSLLALAVMQGHIACVDKILKLGVEQINHLRIGDNHWTLLHLAIYAKQSDLLKHLFQHYEDQVRHLIECPDIEGQTPVMLAAAKGNIEALKLLIENGANLEKFDFHKRNASSHAHINDQKDAIYFLLNKTSNLANFDDYKKHTDEPENDDSSVCERIENKRYLQKQYSCNFYHNKPQNLIFKGGGAKGIAYVGAIVGLEKCDMLSEVIRVGGTSAGAITATLLAMGYNATEIQTIVASTDGSDFFDHPFTKENLTEHIKLIDYINLARTIVSCIATESPSPLLEQIGNSIYEKIKGFTGLCAGKEFLRWIERIIERETKISSCTFGELAKLVKSPGPGKRFRHLHVFATKFVDRAIIDFNSEDPRWSNLIISEAVRASTSIPVVFKPHVLIFKRKMDTGRYEFYTESGNYHSMSYDKLVEKLENTQSLSECVYVDGGCLANFPLTAFDWKKYTQVNSSSKESEYNTRTLGFRLYSKEQEESKVHEVKSEKTITGVLWQLFSVFRHAESITNRMHADDRDHKRIISIDNEGIGTVEFKVTPDDPKGQRAISNAENTTVQFFEKHKAEISGALPVPPQVKEEKSPASDEASEVLNTKFTYSEILIPILTDIHPQNCSDRIEATKKILLTGVFMVPFRLGQRLCYRMGFDKAEAKARFKILKSRHPLLTVFDKTRQAKEIIEGNAPFFKKNMQTILGHLIFENKKELIFSLSEHKQKVNIKLETGISVIHVALRYKLYGAFEGLVYSEDFISDESCLSDVRGKPLLHQIVKTGDEKAFDILKRSQKLSALVNQTNKNKVAFFIAAKKKSPSLIQRFLEIKEVDLTVVHPKTRKTLLYSLAEDKLENEFKEFINKALRKKVLHKIIDLENQSSGKGDFITFTTTNRTILRLLIQHGIDLSKTRRNTNLLHLLVQKNDTELVRLFCQQLCARRPTKQQVEVLDHPVLYKRGFKSPRKKTPLMVALRNKNLEILKILIEHGADFRKEIDGKTPKECLPFSSFGDNSAYRYLNYKLNEPIQIPNAYNQREQRDYWYESTDFQTILQAPSFNAKFDHCHLLPPIDITQMATLQEAFRKADNSPVLCLFNINNSHWVTFCLVKQDSAYTVLYKDSCGNGNRLLENHLKEVKDKITFKTHATNEQGEDHSSCGVLALYNMSLMAEALKKDKDPFIANFDKFTFCSLEEAKQLRKEAFANLYNEGKKAQEEEERKKWEKLKQFRKMHQAEAIQFGASLEKHVPLSLKIKVVSPAENFSRDSTRNTIALEIATRGENDYCYRLYGSRDVPLKTLQNVLQAAYKEWKEGTDFHIEKDGGNNAPTINISAKVGTSVTQSISAGTVT